MSPALAAFSHSSHASPTVVGFGARIAPLESAESASALQLFAPASRSKSLRIFFPSRFE
jgi:hypothetical protein